MKRTRMADMEADGGLPLGEGGRTNGEIEDTHTEEMEESLRECQKPNIGDASAIQTTVS